MELSEILEAAARRLQVKSDRELCRRLGINIAALPRYRNGTYVPTDDRMVRICLASGIQPERGLLYLNLWRSRGDARTTYRRLLKILDREAAERPQVKNSRNL